MAIDALTAEPPRFTFLVVDGQLVAKDPAAIEAHLDEVRKRHSELVKPAKTEAERTMITAKKAFSRYGSDVSYESHDGSVFVYRGTQQRGTTRATRSTRRSVRRASGAAGSRGDPDEPDPPRGGSDVTVSRRCEGCGASLDGRRPQTRTCDDKCRQRASRKRRRSQLPQALSFELRAWLRAEIDKRRREQLAALKREERREARELARLSEAAA